MKLSDYIAAFIQKLDVRHAFVVTGGAAIHLIDSIAHQDGVDYVCAQHEQGAAMMADGYARASGMGVAIGTSGPGATNMLTGTACAFYDSVPVLYITGQVSTFRLRRDTGVRQLGFQEADTVDMFTPVTKYSVLIEDKMDIRYELEKAVYIALSGRPGPVLVDVPDNLQREDIGDPEALRSFDPAELSADAGGEAGGAAAASTDALVDQVAVRLREAKRPVLILGWGVRCARAEESVRRLVERLGIPYVLSWAVIDLLPHDMPSYAGTFGTHGCRAGNLAVQNADFVLSIGSRLDTHHTGTPKDFARGAHLVMVDVDATELDKFKVNGRSLDIGIAMDAKAFIKGLLNRLEGEPGPGTAAIAPWLGYVEGWKRKYPICPDSEKERAYPSPYCVFDILSDLTDGSELLFADTGCSLAWMMSTFRPHGSQRVFSAFNFTPMGYALPAAIGGAFASGKTSICVSGDGGLQMNIQELATCARHKLPVKVLLFDNQGYGMIQQTQEQWMDARYYAANVDQGLAFPDFCKLADVYGFTVFDLDSNARVTEILTDFLKASGPCFCRVKVPSACRVVPQLKFGRALEDQEPLLDREEFLENLIIEPLDSSRES
ncbi:thiamine pyrophosphate-binding protein [Pseudodesulfovibrio karagichevae]|uniref:Thiamine pyrophosphate-binding protein n=1 Tax=Pseudodesulfovibrio karagichevae TaxID=3239305 RepID=A0ABV4JZ20_9BACT